MPVINYLSPAPQGVNKCSLLVALAYASPAYVQSRYPRCGLRLFGGLQVHSKLPKKSGRSNHPDGNLLVYMGQADEFADTHIDHDLVAIFDGQRSCVCGVQFNQLISLYGILTPFYYLNLSFLLQ